ncbi:hypothetical protein D3C76_1423060 [compost metagenome]
MKSVAIESGMASQNHCGLHQTLDLSLTINQTKLETTNPGHPTCEELFEHIDPQIIITICRTSQMATVDIFEMDKTCMPKRHPYAP